jgi:hypothetical protein
MTGQDTTGAGIGELASYCLHALTSASSLPSPAARSADSSRSPSAGCARVMLAR